MAETKGKKNEGNGGSAGEGTTTGPTPEAKTARMGIRLTPVGNSDQPVVANYAVVNVAPGMAFIDFGFLEPAMLAVLPRVAREGGKLPDAINGKLAARVAMGYDALTGLHQQIGRVLTSLSKQRATGGKQPGN